MGNAVHDALRHLAWEHGEVSVSAFGGMIGPCAFTLPGGRSVSPFHSAPWLTESAVDGADGLLAGLQGEWPCVPFGYPMPAPDGPDSWPAGWPGDIEAAAQVSDVHGYSSAARWRFDGNDKDAIALHVDYPDDHAIARLERIVRPVPDAPALDIDLVIHVRRATCEPVGLHGCFRLPPLTGAAVLKPGRFRVGRTHPLTVEPEAPIFAPDTTFDSLSAVKARVGDTIDASRLPFAANGEDLLQLDGIDGHFAMAVGESGSEDGYRVTFDWDADLLPSVLLWYSNRGRSAPPWNNRHLCIGIEPICSAFGLSPDLSRSGNPVSAAGTPTCLRLTPRTPLTIRYRIGVEDLT